MIKELVIHLGDCKTGTTSVQTTLARQQYTTERHSLIFPARFNHMPFAKRIGDRPKLAQAMARDLAEAFSASDADVGVISAEEFEFVPPEKIVALFQGPFKPWRDRVRLISYIRPHAERFVSTFAERSKKDRLSGNMEKLSEQLLSQKLLFYTPRIAAWRAAFGDRYTVRPFIRDYLEDGDVVRDFFSFALGDTPVRFTAKTDQNESLSLEDLVLMRYTHSLLKAQSADLKEAEKALGWNFSPILAAQPARASTKLQLHKSLARRLQETYAEDAAALDALAFEGTPMSDRLARAADMALDQPQSLEPEDHHSPDVLRLAAAYAELIARMMAADPAHFRWATRPEHFRSPLVDQLENELASLIPSATKDSSWSRKIVLRALTGSSFAKRAGKRLLGRRHP